MFSQTSHDEKHNAADEADVQAADYEDVERAAFTKTFGRRARQVVAIAKQRGIETTDLAELRRHVRDALPPMPRTGPERWRPLLRAPDGRQLRGGRGTPGCWRTPHRPRCCSFSCFRACTAPSGACRRMRTHRL